MAEWGFTTYYDRPERDVDAWVQRIKSLSVK
jgi:hypothetical protein